MNASRRCGSPACRVVAAGVLLLTGSLGHACHRAPPGDVKTESIRAGDERVAAGRFGEAAAAYRRAVDVDPNDGATRMKLARVLEQDQQWTNAAREAMRAADLLPGSDEARLLAARLVLTQGRFEDSLALTTSLLRLRPDDVNLLVLWGTATAQLISPYWAVFKLGSTGGKGPAYEMGCTTIRPRVAEDRDRAAEEALRRAVALEPGSFDARFALLNFLWATRRADEVTQLLGTLADELPQHALLNETAGHYFIARGEVDLGEWYLANAATAPAPQDRNSRLSLAERYISTGRHLEALKMLDGLDPANDEGGSVSVRRAEATLGLERYAEAARQLDAITARFPAHARAYLLKARLHLATNDPVAALNAADTAVKANPSLAEARFELARSLEALDDLDLAYKEYREALRLDPTMPDVPTRLAAVGLRTGRDRNALTHAEQAHQRFPESLAVRLTLIEALIRTGNVTAAGAMLSPLLKAEPVAVEALVLRGLLLAREGKAAAAAEALEAALAAEPTSTGAFEALVNLQLSQGQFAVALGRTEAAVTARPGNVDRLRLLGLVFRAQGDLGSAERTFRRALAVQPANTDAALLLAECVASQRRTVEAQGILEQVLQRRPTSLPAQTAMGAILETLGREDDAQQRYEAVLAEYPDAIDAAARLAVLLVSRGRSAEIALGVLDEARRNAPDDVRVNDALGWVQLHRDQVADAIKHLQAATRQDPRNPTYHFHLGVAYSRAGRPAPARAALSQALSLSAAFPDRARAAAELARLQR